MGSSSLLAELQTIKAASLEEQARTIRSLAKRNLDLYDTLIAVIRSHPDRSAFETKLRVDKETVLQVALLAVVAADMACVPYSRGRETHKRRLRWLCAELGVEYDAVVTLLPHVRAIEEILESGIPKNARM